MPAPEQHPGRLLKARRRVSSQRPNGVIRRIVADVETGPIHGSSISSLVRPSHAL
jgi:hypothetical protein